MPARTVVPPRTGLVAHVPVDRVEMVLGPGAIKCMEAQAELQAHADDPEPFYVELDFTLRTAASESAFRRTLKMATIFYVRADLGTFQFTALFSGCIVSGVYNMKDRTGWFTLD